MLFVYYSVFQKVSQVLFALTYMNGYLTDEVINEVILFSHLL